MAGEQGSAASSNDAGQNKSVSQEDVTKLQNANDSLKNELDTLRTQLLDPGYIEYLSDKKKKSSAPDTKVLDLLDELKPEDIDKLPNSKVLKLAEKVLGEKIRGEMAQEITSLRTALMDISAMMEVQQMKAEFPDFEEHVDEIRNILQNAKSDLTVRQAYLQAKGEKAGRKKEDKEKDKKPQEKESSGGEKPNQSSLADDKEKAAPKTVAERNSKILSELKEKHGLSGDTL